MWLTVSRPGSGQSAIDRTLFLSSSQVTGQSCDWTCLTRVAGQSAIDRAFISLSLSHWAVMRLTILWEVYSWIVSISDFIVESSDRYPEWIKLWLSTLLSRTSEEHWHFLSPGDRTTLLLTVPAPSDLACCVADRFVPGCWKVVWLSAPARVTGRSVTDHTFMSRV